MHQLRKVKGENFNRRNKMVRKANHGRRPCRGKRHNRFACGKG